MPPGPADGKRRLIRGEGLVARISNEYRPQLPVVGKDIPEPAVPCHVGTARLEETVNIQTRSVGRAVRRPYSDSEESDNDVLYAEEHDSALQRVNLRNEWSTQTTVDSCGEWCAQLDDFKWFLLTDERARDLSAPELEIDTSDSESGVDFIDSDSTPLQTESMEQQLLCPPVVVQTRRMEGCHTAVPRRSRRGRDVRTADDAVAVNIRTVSAASDIVVSRKIHRKSECVPTVVPKLAVAPQATYEVVQPRPRDYSYMDSLPPGSGCLDSPRIDTPETAVSSMEVAGGSPDRLQTELSVATTEMAGGSPPADIDICVVPDVLPIAMSVKTVMSDKSMEMDTPDGVVSRMEMTGGSPPVEIDISRNPDMLQISVTATEIVGGSPPADIHICVVPDVLPMAMSVKTVMSGKSMEILRIAWYPEWK